MKRIVNVICAIDLIFLLLLVLSSMTYGILSEVLYYVALIVPIAIGAYYIKRERPYTENPHSVYIGLDKSSLAYFLPLAAPAIALIIAVAYITASVMGAFGITGGETIDLALPEALLIFALVPAVLEEALFRYIPLKLLLPYSKKWAVILSALFFSVVHTDLFKLPYAFVAGIIFALADINCKSVIPSVIIHFVNNAASVIIIKSSSDTVSLAIYLTIGVLALISAIIVAIRHNVYRDFAKPLYEKEEKAQIGTAPAVISALCVFLAAGALIS